MPRTSLYAAPTWPFATWLELATKFTEMLWASAQVISHRTQRMAASTIPSQRDQREFRLMGQEKVEAAAESAIAMASQFMTLNPMLAAQAWSDMAAAGAALMALTTSRTLPAAMAHHTNVLRTASQSAASASRIAHASARIATHGLKPIHSRATANAKRLGRR